MSTQSTAASGAFDSPAATTATMSPTRPLYWSVRRELWEYRSLYIAPLAVAGVIISGFLVSSIGVLHVEPRFTHRGHEGVAAPYDFASVLLMGTVFLVGLYYCLDTLHGERRDRSILFWKSLPVSDVTMVLSKAVIPLVILPLLAFAIVVATQFVMLLLNSAVWLVRGMSVSELWTQVSWGQMSLMLLYHLVTVHALWYAPIYGWLLLVSAWARRAPFLWAVLPPFAIGALEKLVLNTSYFGNMLGRRFGGGPEMVVSAASGRFPVDPNMVHLTPGHFLVSPGLWGGLAVTAVFLFIAARVRRSRGPI